PSTTSTRSSRSARCSGSSRSCTSAIPCCTSTSCSWPAVRPTPDATAGAAAASLGTMRPGLALVLTVALLASTGCSVTGPQRVARARSDAPRATADPAAADAAAVAIDVFGFDVYRRLAAANPSAGVVFSPASIAIALAMARAGARAETAAQMDAVMHAVGSDANAAGINALDQALAARSGTFQGRDGKPYDLTRRIANAPSAQRDLKLEPAL